MNTKKTGWVLSVCLLSLLVACSSLKMEAMNDNLDKAVELYHQSMRWGNWPSLIRQIRPRPDTKVEPLNLYVVDRNFYASLRIIRVDMGHSSFDPENFSASTPVSIDYMSDYSNRVEKYQMTLSWWYDQERKMWFTETPLPKFSGWEQVKD